jgi:co-chaperonin GroES (HSP10)|tara:strand:- start:308 stop:565 length:258 start_codon:yes stop_codon:yes gene_type:complete
MQAVNYYLVVDPIKDKDKKIGGLLISDTLDVDHRYSKGTIITKGNLVEGVNNGDIIHYDKHAGHQIHWKDNVYEVIKAPDIVLVE